MSPRKTTMQAATKTDAKQTTVDERKLASVRQKIKRGAENLALAKRENFAAISKLVVASTSLPGRRR